MKDNLPVLDYEKAGVDFSVAAEVCPASCFVVEGAVVVASEGVAAAGSQEA